MNKISIIIPCYNAEEWINQCVESALSQDHSNVEVIAIDNESTDNTVKILNEIKERHPQLIIGSAPNIYPHCWDEAREEGLKKATGDYLTFMCSDDFIDKSYITNCMRYLTATDKIKAIQSLIRNVKDGIQLDYYGHSYNSLEEFKTKALTHSPVNTPTVIYSREIYDSGLLTTEPEKYSGAADYDLYCKLADKDIMIYPVNKWLGYNYRWHPNQATWGMHKEPENYDKKIQEFWKDKWQLV